MQTAISPGRTSKRLEHFRLIARYIRPCVLSFRFQHKSETAWQDVSLEAHKILLCAGLCGMAAACFTTGALENVQAFIEAYRVRYQSWGCLWPSLDPAVVGYANVDGGGQSEKLAGVRFTAVSELQEVDSILSLSFLGRYSELRGSKNLHPAPGTVKWTLLPNRTIAAALSTFHFSYITEAAVSTSPVLEWSFVQRPEGVFLLSRVDWKGWFLKKQFMELCYYGAIIIGLAEVERMRAESGFYRASLPERKSKEESDPFLSLAAKLFPSIYKYAQEVIDGKLGRSVEGEVRLSQAIWQHAGGSPEHLLIV
jgi:hypothetical protein